MSLDFHEHTADCFATDGGAKVCDEPSPSAVLWVRLRGRVAWEILESGCIDLGYGDLRPFDGVRILLAGETPTYPKNGQLVNLGPWDRPTDGTPVKTTRDKAEVDSS